MKKALQIIVLAFGLVSQNSKAQTITETFGTGANQFSIEFVNISNPGNVADTDPRNTTMGGSHGDVGYIYNIGKYELTVSQYTGFLNSVAKTDAYGLFNPNMYGVSRSGTSGNFSYSVTQNLQNRPITYISWFDAARFVNWLNNGANENASTETGVYSINGMTNGVPWTQIPNSTRNPTAKYFIPTYEELYKAGWYDPNKNGGIGGYWDGPVGSDLFNSSQMNIWAQVMDENGSYTTDVGSYPFSSPYGTFDQGGNVWEMTEFVNGGNDLWWKGGSAGDTELGASKYYQGGGQSQREENYLGLRIGSVPEPSALSLLAVGLGGLALVRRRLS